MIAVDIIAAFLIAVLSGMGIGSGGLFVIYLTLVLQTPQLTAQGINLMFFLFSSGSALIIHLQKRKILWGAVLMLTVGGVFGAIFGSFVAGLLPSSTIRKIFGGMLLASGTLALFKKDKKENQGSHLKR